MKKFLLLLFALISTNTYAQINVKEGSFHKIEGFLMLDKEDHRDDNWNPMALIKITAEGMKAEERARLEFHGNGATYIDVQQMGSQTYLYLTAQAATFLEIIHPDYGKTEYWFPEDLCDHCGYEMVIQHIPLTPVTDSKPQNTYFIIKSDQNDALIYIDNDFVGTKEISKLFTIGSTHSWRIECNMYHSESGTVTLKEKTTINKQMRPAFGYLDISTSPEQGARVYVDGEYIGDSPCKTDKLKSGTHNVRVMKDMYKMTEQSITVTDGKTTSHTIDMAANFVNVTVTTNSSSIYDIYIDEVYKGFGSWTGKLSKGTHLFEARKDKHRSSSKNVFLEVGSHETIILDTPTPINGTLDINSNPMGAQIYIDGKSYGETPNYISDVLIGEHELKLTLQGYNEIKRSINIKEDDVLSLNLELQKQENAEELFNLGYNYEKGNGVKQDYSKAVEYYTKAANMGHAGAQCNLGNCYFYGFYNVKPDKSKAVKWYTKAANQGNASAQFNLGLFYEYGYGVKQDYAKAVEWYTKAANQGNASAQFYLGVFYEKGRGVKQDYSKAVEWYTKAANQGYADAQYSLGYCYENGHGVKQDYAKAVEWYQKAANQGYANAQCNLGYCYGNGHGVKLDYAKAVEYYTKAANQGNRSAQFNLGVFYENGYGVKQNYAKAVEWYKKAAEQGDEDAKTALKRLGY